MREIEPRWVLCLSEAIDTLRIRQTAWSVDRSTYVVNVFGRRIIATVTDCASAVKSWLCSISHIYRRHLSRLVVGLDVEWRPSYQRGVENPVAVLQLCVGQRCLIFQLIHADAIPQKLVNFLADARFTFVGVGIEEDERKLLYHYGLMVESVKDLRSLAVDYLGDKVVKSFGLKKMAASVLKFQVEKPESIARSAWDARVLSSAQVQYACLDAYLSFRIGMKLIFETDD